MGAGARFFTRPWLDDMILVGGCLMIGCEHSNGGNLLGI